MIPRLDKESDAVAIRSIVARAARRVSVVIARLQKVDAIVVHEIDQAMLLRNAPRPNTGAEILQRFRFSDIAERLPHNRFDQLQNTERGTTIRFNPIA